MTNEENVGSGAMLTSLRNVVKTGSTSVSNLGDCIIVCRPSSFDSVSSRGFLLRCFRVVVPPARCERCFAAEANQIDPIPIERSPVFSSLNSHRDAPVQKKQQ